jgi:KipI family sensor histidine kinase inhibitor
MDAVAPYPRLLPAGDSAVLVELGAEINPSLNQRVHDLATAIARSAFRGLIAVVPGYASLLVHYDPLHVRADEVLVLLGERLAGSARPERRRGRLREVPTCYGGVHGPDLENVAALHGLAVDEVVRLHSEPTYLVYFLGFAPGFAYMGEVPRTLATPRLETPRTSVPAGSVGIAGTQTGVYAVSTPGGWRLLGRTPLRLFDPRRDPPTFFLPGDRVRFVPIDDTEFRRLERRGDA